MNGDNTEKPRHEPAVHGSRGIKIVKNCTIQKPALELFAFWRELENLPRFMRHLVSVTETTPTQSHWVAKGPSGDVSWDAVIINEHPGEMIAWRTTEGAQIPNAGTVRFHSAPGQRGTEVTVALEYEPPAGKIGAMVARLFGEEPDLQVDEDLRRFKALMETGEIPTIEGQSAGGKQNSGRDQ